MFTSTVWWPRHRDRLAVAYVRHSIVPQVLDHQELTRLKYSLGGPRTGAALDRVLDASVCGGARGSGALTLSRMGC